MRSKKRVLSFGNVGRGLYLIPALALALLSACATGGGGSFRNAQFDFGSIQTVGIMPLMNLSRDAQAGDRIRDVFITSLLSTEGMYVIPPGEVARGIISVGVSIPPQPTPEEVIKLCKVLKIDGLLTGAVREYGEVRSGSAVANVISMSMQLFENQTGKVVWSASATEGGIGVKDRLFGGGGESMNVVTEKAVDDIINKLFK